jgi:serine phosphatase RsbU (regulator of sigma subunit)
VRYSIIRRTEEEFGIERCKSRLFQDRHLPLAQSLDSLICALDEWRRDDPIRDDITLLGVEYRGAP